MRLVSFEKNGHPGFGVVVGDGSVIEGGIVDATARLPGKPHGLREALAGGALAALEDLAGGKPDFALDAITFAPVIPDPGAKLLCVGVNYMPHIKEMGRERPEKPVIFTRFGDSIVGHGRPLLMPLASEQFDFEGELAVVIGKRARRVSKERALDYVAGYACFNDGSVRDYQRHSPQFTPGKNFHASGAFGPWLVTADEIPDPRKLRLTTRLNGEVMQHESVGELCFDVPHLIEYCSIWTQLEPGDVIVTGTPGGVGAGRKPPLWMKPGDTIEVEITGIGTLRNPVVAEAK
jgi:2-keto-4-pentenoate hydratase/2-oxohepta-3-ene-1,7-dioic acid hydratase in catechol pathway